MLLRIQPSLEDIFFYKLYHIADGKTVTVGATDMIHGVGEVPIGGAVATDAIRSSGELIYFGDL